MPKAKATSGESAFAKRVAEPEKDARKAGYVPSKDKPADLAEAEAWLLRVATGFYPIPRRRPGPAMLYAPRHSLPLDAALPRRLE
jgi:hypothetical protein